MDPAARSRRMPLLALTLALGVGVSLSGIAPAHASAGAPALPRASAAVADARIPAPAVVVGGEVTDVPEIEVYVSLDADGLDLREPRFEYLLDGSGSWRTAHTGQLDSAVIRIPAPAGPHVIAFRVAGVLDGVPVTGRASADVPVRSLGFPTPYDPVITVDGPRITLAWDVRAALAGWPEERSVTYSVDGGPSVVADAVGTVTADVGYDRIVAVDFRHGPNADVARYLYLRVATASRPGSLPLTSTPNPAIVGSATPGATLTVRTGTWRPAPVTLTYQWYADGAQIPGATEPSYRVSEYDDPGRRISVAVRGSAPGRISVERLSAPTPRVPAPVISAGLPSVGGLPLVGRELTVRPGSWRPAPVTLAYQWLRDGTVIVGATSATYVPTEADRGRLLAVRVTGSKPAHPSATRTSVAVRVGG